MFQKLVKQPFISFFKRYPPIYRLGYEMYLRQETKPWRTLFSKDKKFWQEMQKNPEKKPKVLIATGIAGHATGALLESMLAAACTLRGAEVHILLCNSVLGACITTQYPELERKNQTGNRRIRCDSCVTSGKMWFWPMGLPIHYYEENVNQKEREEARELAAIIPLDTVHSFSYKDIAVGEHALAGALRYYARGDLSGEPNGEIILRKYLESSLLATFAVTNLVTKNKFDVACFHHGIYSPQGLVGEVCRKHGVRVVNWNPAYRKHCFIFSHGDSYHHTMITEPTSVWEDVCWNPLLEKRTMDYLKSRWQGTNDWIWFHDRPNEDPLSIQQEIGADCKLPWITMLTNVMWDAQLHYKSNAFKNMLEWVLQTIRYFETRKDLQLIIRVHPAEIRGTLPSRQLLVNEIKKSIPVLPENVFVISPDSQISTYELAAQSNAVIIYNTKTGIEISSMGIPVIVAGEAWIRNKGFSIDASSPSDYFSILDGLHLTHSMSADEILRARKYAFHFFFRRMIPLPFISTKTDRGSELILDIPSLENLLPRKYTGLDVICDGILTGSPFIYPAENEKEINQTYDDR
jgi:hypothetical protein